MYTDSAATILAAASQEIWKRSGEPAGLTPNSRPPAFRAVGIALAIASGVFIGVSFVLKKVGLLKANVKYNEEAGEGYGYLKNFYWWGGMVLMIIGEVCNFVAYAFVDAILVTPLGALSVVVTTILSAIFLKERLSFVGKVACFQCIIGSIVIVLNAPAQSSIATIQDMQHFVVHPAFLTYAGVVIAGCIFVALWAGPRYGKKSMMVYLTICSLIGGLSVVATQGLGAAVIAQAQGTPQFNQWFLYVLLVFVIATLLTEIIYLNKALNLFNAALVTPTYYVYFTSSTIVSSAILFRGFRGTPQSIATIVMGFLTICAGVVLLQLSKSAKDVPDSAVLAGDLDQVRVVAEQEQSETEPKADAIRGTAAIVRRLSQTRQKMEAEEAKRVYEDKMKDQMEPINENEEVHWDGIRRRRTIRINQDELQRRKSMHPPLMSGLTRFPSYDEDEANRPQTGRSDTNGGFERFFSFRRSTAASNATSPLPRRRTDEEPQDEKDVHGNTLETIPSGDGMEMQGMSAGRKTRQRSSTEIPRSSAHRVSHRGQPIKWAGESARDSDQSRLSPKPQNTSRRQFSFQNLFQRSPSGNSGHESPSSSRRPTTSHSTTPKIKNATEEELHGLVKGDSHQASDNDSASNSDNEETTFPGSNMDRKTNKSSATLANPSRSKELEAYEESAKRWSGSSPELRTPGGGRPLPKTPTEDDESDADEEIEKSIEVKPLDAARRPRGGRGGGAPPAFI